MGYQEKSVKGPGVSPAMKNSGRTHARCCLGAGRGVMPGVQIPEQEERRPPRQCNSQKGKFIADSSQGSCRIQHSGVGSESPKPKLLHRFIG